MKEAYVIGDIHGQMQALEAVLTRWKPTTQRLIFVGDYIDRGPDSKAVLEKVWQLESQHDVVAIRGNHEQMLLNYLEDPQNRFDHYERNGGVSTIASLLDIEEDEITLDTAIKHAEMIQSNYPHLIEWLMNLPYYTEFGKFVIVHAGVDLSKDDWRQTEPYDMIWIRDAFHDAPNHTDRYFIFGHTPIQTMHDKHDLWYGEAKVNIDGGAGYGRLLIGIHIDEQNILKTDTYLIQKGQFVHG